MILEKSGMPKKYTVASNIPSFEDAGINDSFVSNVSEETVKIKEKETELIKDSDKKIFQKKKQETMTHVEKPSKDDVENNICNSDNEKTEIKEKTDVEKLNKLETESHNISLSEKYKPKDLKQIVGQQMSNSNMNKLKKWLECWYINEKLRKQKKIVQPKPWDKTNDGGYFKCALLSGPPGVGKYKDGFTEQAEF